MPPIDKKFTRFSAPPEPACPASGVRARVIELNCKSAVNCVDNMPYHRLHKLRINDVVRTAKTLRYLPVNCLNSKSYATFDRAAPGMRAFVSSEECCVAMMPNQGPGLADTSGTGAIACETVQLAVCDWCVQALRRLAAAAGGHAASRRRRAAECPCRPVDMQSLPGRDQPVLRCLFGC